MANEFSGDLDRLSRADVARLLNVSSRHVAELTGAGILPCEREGRRVFYAWRAVLAGFLQRTSNKGGVSEALAEKYRIDAERGKVKLGVESGRLCNREALSAAYVACLMVIKNNLLGLPGKWAVPLAAAGTPAKVNMIVKKEVLGLFENLRASFDRVTADRTGTR